MVVPGERCEGSGVRQAIEIGLEGADIGVNGGTGEPGCLIRKDQSEPGIGGGLPKGGGRNEAVALGESFCHEDVKRGVVGGPHEDPPLTTEGADVRESGWQDPVGTELGQGDLCRSVSGGGEKCRKPGVHESRRGVGEDGELVPGEPASFLDIAGLYKACRGHNHHPEKCECEERAEQAESVAVFQHPEQCPVVSLPMAASGP